MTPAKEILEMIEKVDPSDTAKLDEIDARVGEYLGRDTYHGRYVERFTRSRDALKAIRPEGWSFSMSPNACVLEKQGDVVEVLNSEDRGSIGIFRTKRSKWNLPTEELAELHTVIQAVDHERNAA